MCLIECIIYKRLDSITQLFAYNFLITLIILNISGCLYSYFSYLPLIYCKSLKIIYKVKTK